MTVRSVTHRTEYRFRTAVAFRFMFLLIAQA